MKKMITFKNTIFLKILFAIFLIFPTVLTAEEGRIIKIEATGGKTYSGIKALPAKLTIEKDVIVIWLNTLADDDISILFENGEAIKGATANPMGFGMDRKGIYGAKYLTFIATTSLRFIKEGTYHYKVVSQQKKFTHQGTITVE